MVVDAGKGGEARDPEDGGANELSEAGEKPEVVEIVRVEGVDAWKPDPGRAGVIGGILYLLLAGYKPIERD